MITVQVFNQSMGSPYPNVQVHVFPNYSGGGYHEWTNGRGEAHFASLTPGNHEVLVEGKSVFKGHLEGSQVVYV